MIRILHFGLSLLLVCLSGCGSNLQPKEKQAIGATEMGGSARLVFENEMVNFGTIKAGETVGIKIPFKSEGEGILVFKDAETSCDCLEVLLPSEPFKPGESGSIEVIFDSKGFYGRQVKQVRVYSNDDSKQANEITIWATVIAQ
jgi:hypothetical protein